jgi:hypothetical protein
MALFLAAGKVNVAQLRANLRAGCAPSAAYANLPELAEKMMLTRAQLVERVGCFSL